MTSHAAQGAAIRQKRRRLQARADGAGRPLDASERAWLAAHPPKTGGRGAPPHEADANVSTTATAPPDERAPPPIDLTPADAPADAPAAPDAPNAPPDPNAGLGYARLIGRWLRAVNADVAQLGGFALPEELIAEVVEPCAQIALASYASVERLTPRQAGVVVLAAAGVSLSQREVLRRRARDAAQSSSSAPGAARPDDGAQRAAPTTTPGQPAGRHWSEVVIRGS